MIDSDLDSDKSIKIAFSKKMFFQMLKKTFFLLIHTQVKIYHFHKLKDLKNEENEYITRNITALCIQYGLPPGVP